MSAYAPPPHPPSSSSPSNHARSSSATSTSSSSYAPTTVPTPGQPLLRNGRMLVYPNGWRGCPKCLDTGYKHGDPSHPCRKCWQEYGKTFNPMLISTANMQGAKVLQKPLAPQGDLSGSDPFRQSMPGAYVPASNHAPGHAGYPGSMSLQPQMTGYSGPPPGAATSSFAPPSQPPPPRVPPRRDPVSRTQESREDDINEDGEAPPAYADVVAAGPDGALPPQRADERRDQLANGTSNAQPPHNPPLSPPPQHGGSGFHHQAPYGGQQPYMGGGPHPPPPNGWYPPQQGPPMPGYGGGGGGPMMARVLPYGYAPPANALVLRAGDPRLGGRLCHKCGGDGVREDFWFGFSETCRHCNGTGRLM